ncbi:ead/Ea22-like family protein [Salmonella enterica]|uniref:ead/Ea22-like family protein n=1 Tax=Salmonella enterica TaxID=28901 RepID=UPI003D31FAB3
MQDHYSDPADRDRQIIYIAAEALLDENIQLQREKDAIETVALALRDDMRQAREQLKAAEHTAAVDHEAACSLVEENEELKRKLETAEKQIVELSRAANVNNQWKPDVCPVTGRKFFMWIEHETLGYVPTYGGPFDSYTIPTRDSSGEFSCERYDHDFGGWVEGEFIGLYLIDDDEQCRVCELEERIAELEAKLETADKLQDSAFRDGLKAGFSYGQTDDQSGFTQCMSAYSTRAGIGVKQQQDSVDSDVGSRNQPGMVVAVHIDAGDFVKVYGQVFEVEETDFDDHDVTLWFVGGNALKCAAGCPVEVVSEPVAADIKVKES